MDNKLKNIALYEKLKQINKIIQASRIVSPYIRAIEVFSTPISEKVDFSLFSTKEELRVSSLSNSKTTKGRKTVTAELNYAQYVEYYCRQRVDYGRKDRIAKDNTVKHFKEKGFLISAKTLSRAIEKNSDILDTFKIK